MMLVKLTHQTGADIVRLFARRTVASPVTNDACCLHANAVSTHNVSSVFLN